MPAAIPTFEESLKRCNSYPLRAAGITTLQVNLGRMCNQACKHCHVEAGPHRTEMMGNDVMAACLGIIARGNVPIVDITGGAPELHPRYRHFAAKAAKNATTLITRTNLTILGEDGMTDLPVFWREIRAVVVASLPFWRKEETDAVRGRGVFDASIAALQKLNAAGYGMDGSGLLLHLAYSPAGAFLPAPQEEMERQFREVLEERHGIRFNRLFAMANMPLARFKEHLQRKQFLDSYMRHLAGAFNADAAPNVMCRQLVSVGWNGNLYDCDFNQMLDLRIDGNQHHISLWDSEKLKKRQIMTGEHCYGCTAGGGSSCGGAIS